MNKCNLLSYLFPTLFILFEELVISFPFTVSASLGDPGSILGLGWVTGEGIGYPLQYYWASLMAQLEKNLPTMRETWAQSLGWEDPLEKG